MAACSPAASNEPANCAVTVDLCYISASFAVDTERFQCPICLGVCCDAVSLPCGHTFGFRCIKSALGFRATCPLDRSSASVKDLVPAFKDRMEIMGLLRHCKFSAAGCTHTASTRQLVEHELSQCAFRQISCDQCHQGMLISELSQHLVGCTTLLDCAFASVGCVFRGRAAEIATHESLCMAEHLVLSTAKIARMKV